jgi:hypothetical protein
MTAATERYLIEATGGRVDLCEQRGGQWVTIRRGVSQESARRVGFNLDAPAVQRVFLAATEQRMNVRQEG